MKTRVIRNWITTIVGALLMLIALTMFIGNRIPSMEVDFSWFEMLGTILFGWVFLMAKDSLIEGLFMGLFKVEAKE